MARVFNLIVPTASQPVPSFCRCTTPTKVPESSTNVPQTNCIVWQTLFSLVVANCAAQSGFAPAPAAGNDPIYGKAW